MATRENMLIAEATKLLPPGATLEAVLATIPGKTKSMKLVAFLEGMNEMKTKGARLEGYFVGDFLTKKLENFWRILTAEKTVLVRILDNPTKFAPMFGRRLLLENIDQVHYNISGRDSFDFSSYSKAASMPGNILELAKDLNAMPEGYGLFTGQLYKIERTKIKDEEGFKPIIDEKGINLKLTCRGLQSDTDDRRYASGFIPSVQMLLSICTNKDEMNQLADALEHGNAEEVMELCASLAYNPSLQMDGTTLLVYGELSTQDYNGKTFWNIKHIQQVFNTELLEALNVIPTSAPAPQYQYQAAPPTGIVNYPPQGTLPTMNLGYQPGPTGTVTQTQPNFGPPTLTPGVGSLVGSSQASWTPNNINPQVAQALMPAPIPAPSAYPPVPAAPTVQLDPAAALKTPYQQGIENDIRGMILDQIKMKADIRVMDIVTAVMDGAKVCKQDVIDGLNWLLQNGYLQPDKRAYRIIKDL